MPSKKLASPLFMDLALDLLKATRSKSLALCPAQDATLISRQRLHVENTGSLSAKAPLRLLDALIALEKQ